LPFGHHLGTVVEGQRDATPHQNPYASPSDASPSDATSSRPARSSDATEFDLTEASARRAEAVVWDAQAVFLLALLGVCACAPVWLFMLPWYGYRLHCWNQLSNEFAELRNPNAFSPHGELAIKFRDAHGRLWIGVIAGLGAPWLRPHAHAAPFVTYQPMIRRSLFAHKRKRLFARNDQSTKRIVCVTISL
jgi:hypothetical protein